MWWTRSMKLGFCDWKSMQEMRVECKLNEAFLHFLLKLFIFDDFSKWRSCGSLKNHYIWWQKFGKKWRKALFNLPSTHSSMLLRVPKTHVSGTHSATNNNMLRICMLFVIINRFTSFSFASYCLWSYIVSLTFKKP